MTTRAIKKLTKKDDLKILKDKLSLELNENDEKELSEDELEYKPVNKFNLVNKSTL